jgi:hypothetical protein
MLPQSRLPITHIPAATRARRLMLGMAPVAPPATQAASGVFSDAPIRWSRSRNPLGWRLERPGSSFPVHTGESLRSGIGTAGPCTIEARLRYQVIKPALVKKLSADSGRVVRFRQMYQRLPPAVSKRAVTVIAGVAEPRRVTPFFFPGILLRFAGL